MSVTINGTSGVTFNDASTQTTAATGFGFKNRILNGAMVIDQRNAGASVTANDGTFVVDRFKYVMSQNSKGTTQRSTTAPAGFTNSILFTSSSAYTVGASELFLLTQVIEGFNIADLGWGTASAQTVTVSFQVRSSLTGTFGGAVENASRFYPFSYTINAANTWETKTITIAGDTSGTWDTTNGSGIRLRFSLGAGSSVSGAAGAWTASTAYSATGATSVVGTNGATFYITGVQLEKGSTATSFDYRPYSTELQLAQRYYYRMSPASASGMFGAGYTYGTTSVIYYQKFPVNMRAASTALEQSGTAAHYGIYEVGSTVTCTSVPVFNTADFDGATVLFTASGLTAGRGSIGRSLNTAAYLGWSAEL